MEERCKGWARSRIYLQASVGGYQLCQSSFYRQEWHCITTQKALNGTFFKSHAKIVEEGKGRRSHPFQALYFTDEETVLQTWNENINTSQWVYDKVRTKTISSPRVGPVPLCHAKHTQHLGYKKGAWEKSLTFNPLFSTYRLVPITFVSSIEYMTC